MFDPNDENYKRAKQRVDELKGFYIHLAVTVALISCLFVIDVLSGSGFWFQWPSFVFTTLVVIHAAVTFVPANTSDWEDRKIRELMEKQGQKPKKELLADESYFERTSDV
jgi:hypothetical protein